MSYWPNPSDLSETLSDHQIETLEKCFRSRVSILAGTPGTGKTYTAGAVISELSRNGLGHKIAIAAPTGKAAVRLTSTLTGYGIGIEATTIHRLLKPLRNGHDGQGWGFLHGRANPLPFEIYFIDESSMIDASLGAELFAAIPPTAHVCLIGDPYQLPPVGNGAPLRDLIRSGRVGYGELSEVRRNSGRIVQACREIKDGERFEGSERISIDEGENLYHIETRNAHDSLSALIRLVRNPPAGVDPVWDVQAIVPLNKSGDLSRESVNEKLQNVLNPDGETVEGIDFWLGDKAICLSNGWHELRDEDGEPIDEAEGTSALDLVANGEIGRVVSIDGEGIDVEIEIPKRRVRVPRKPRQKGDPTLRDWALAYAVTCHKMQGSSSKIAIVLVDDSGGGNFLCSREWHYTAISRAEDLCLTIGKRSAINRQCQTVALNKRRTFLTERISRNGNP